MKQLLFFLALSGFILSCSTNRAISSRSSGRTASSISTQDGSSFENAVFIEQKTEKAGVDAEYEWLRNHYPGYKLIQQSLTNKNKKPYDLLEIETTAGLRKSVYFDISGFFGKF